MKKCYLDSNVLVYYGNKDSAHYSLAQNIIANLIQGEYEISISSLVIDEYEYAGFKYINTQKEIVVKRLRKGLRRIFTIPNLNLINPPLEAKSHLKVLKFILKYKLRPRDAYHLFIMKENKIKYMATFDHDFDKIFEEGRIKKFTVVQS